MEYIEHLEMNRMIYEVKVFLERMKTASKTPLGGGPSVFTEAAMAQMPANAAIADLVYRSALSGDPDGSPALVAAKRSLVEFHRAQLDRLSGEVRALEGRGGR